MMDDGWISTGSVERDGNLIILNGHASLYKDFNNNETKIQFDASGTSSPTNNYVSVTANKMTLLYTSFHFKPINALPLISFQFDLPVGSVRVEFKTFGPGKKLLVIENIIVT